ncbi:hypothetical protein HYPGJ_20155 [Hyphomicrobium sp. GJ21]|jgi:hypothetical protein|uniref:hypothetical protein n=1 Tax=Hyphomicrobium sp. GJ21 TaxID=113574 RepID=UPI000622B81E|nr:hypothetical protein [Hyphomicrobium sp. GJ21]CEJ84207.1 hypothetical protein HYPGJ_20155 [Hyphomicrobium sp. GJ21]
MRQKSSTPETPSERLVRDIRRATRKQYSAEEKIRIVLEALADKPSKPSRIWNRIPDDVSANPRQNRALAPNLEEPHPAGKLHRPSPSSTRDAIPSGRPEHYLQGR